MRARLLLAGLLWTLACLAPAQARTLHATIARVRSPVATMERVSLTLDWPDGADRGRLRLHAGAVDAADLGYHWRDLSWTCDLRRDGDAWRCAGPLRPPRGAPLQLALVLGPASTDAVLQRGPARITLARTAATPDLTGIDLAAVPAAWAQALLAKAWPSATLQAGTLDARLRVRAPAAGPLQVTGPVQARGLSLETADASIAAEHLGADLRVAYTASAGRREVGIDGTLRGGEVLAGNTYVALPDTPVDLSLQATQAGAGGWRLPRLRWRDGADLAIDASAVLAPDNALRDLDLDLHAADLAPLSARYLSGWLGLAGLAGLELRGGLDARLRMADGQLQAARVSPQAVSLVDAKGRFAFHGVDGTVAFSGAGPQDSALAWRDGALYGLDFGAARLPLRSSDGVLRLAAPVEVPMLGGRVRFDGFALRPRRGDAGAEASFGMAVDHLDIGALSKAFGWPAFRGELSGRLPRAHYANERLDFEGGLSMAMFGGRVEIGALSMERPFGVAPTLAADLAIDDLDLHALTEVFDFGAITGRLDGRIDQLRLVDWTVTAFDADLRTDPHPGVRQRISQRAVQNISSVGDASFVSSLQGRLIGLFDDFGYARIGIGCTLANEVCAMRGLRSAGNAFTIVDGAGLPRLTVVGYNRMVDWPTLVERLAAVGKGEVKPVVQ